MLKIRAVGGVLQKIARATSRRVWKFKKGLPIAALRKEALYRRTPLDFAAAFAGPGPRVIAEIKFASPSQGLLRREPGARAAVAVAKRYLLAGASALSVLTEPEFFSGSSEYLKSVRLRFPKAPLLMKDFFLDPYQLELARSCGADAVLLMASLLGAELETMLAGAADLGLSALVEVHTEEELALALKAQAKMIGVNSRNLKTLKTDLQVAHRLAAFLSPRQRRGRLLIAESGISRAQDIAALSSCGYDGFLVGTQLMRRPDPGVALKELLAGL